MHRVPRMGFSWMVALSAAFLLFLGPRAGFGAEKLTVKYSWLFTPSISPVMYGLEKGYYAAEGIDLNLIDGRGSRGNMKLFAAKKLLVGFADSGTAAKFISQGAAAKVIYGYQQSSPLSVIVHSDLGIKDLRGLQGRKVGRAASDSGTALFPALAKRNGVDPSKINFVNVSYAARNTAFLNRDVDGIIAYWPDNVPFLRAKGAKVSYMSYADNGLNVLGTGLLAHDEFIAKNPETLRRLLRGMSKSVAASLKDPEAAVAAIRKRSPLTVKDPVMALKVVKNVLSLVHTSNTTGKPLGWMAKKDWAETIDLLSKHSGLKNPLALKRYYTNEFVPAKPAM